MYLIVTYYYKKSWGWNKSYMKIKGPFTKVAFIKVMLLNEVVKHSLFKPNFDIGNFLTHLKNFNIYIIQ